MKKIIERTALGLAAAGVLYGVGAGFKAGSNAMRQNTLNGFYQEAAEVQTELRTGNVQDARKKYEDMWARFNQTRRDELRDFMGQMTQRDADTFEERANWETLLKEATQKHYERSLGLKHSTEDTEYKLKMGGQLSGKR